MRGLDHLVLPVASLTTARNRFDALGFTVAPQGDHPFGTINACIYFADGTFIEPLAVGNAKAVAAAVAEGNSFVGGDQQFRAARGEEGLSAIVLATDDAGADHQRFISQGISGGPMVEFSRPFVDQDGKADIAAFLLAFATPQDRADGYFFTCERRRVAKVDRSALEHHANGVKRVVAIEAQAADPQRFAEFLVAMAGSEAIERNGQIGVMLDNAMIRISENKDMPAALLSGIVFGVDDVATVAALLSTNAIDYQKHGSTLRVPPAVGQGTWLIFEELG